VSLIVSVLVTLALALGALSVARFGQPEAAASQAPLTLTLLGSYSSGLGEASAETVAHERGRLFITNATSNSLDLVDITSPGNPRLIRRVDLAPFGAGPNSVDVFGGVVAVAIEAAPKTDPGWVLFFNPDGDLLRQVQVGSLPDMLTFSPDGRYMVVANEGEPSSYNQADSVDPEGTVSIITVQPTLSTTAAGGKGGADFVRTVDFRDFNIGGPRHAQLGPEIRIFGPNASVAQDLEPEYITISPDSRTAYITLQENNALAVIDLIAGRVDRLVPLGFKDYSLSGSGIDASDRDGQVNIQPWPVRGVYQPDAIAAYQVGGSTYLVTANEGDARDYPGFAEEGRIGGLDLDPAVFPNAAELKQDGNLGRLAVTRTLGQGPNGYSALHSFGARSFSIWRADTGEQVWDSGDALERITAEAYPAHFNASNSNNEFDNRSDDKGPEPEGVALGTIAGRTYAFVGLERVGGVVVYDVTDPRLPQFVQYVNNRDFSQSAGPDSGPEVVRFVPANASLTGRPLILVANEISGTVTIFEVR
jgi:DNA-binding beta-propeller fold protein YncE